MTHFIEITKKIIELGIATKVTNRQYITLSAAHHKHELYEH